MPPGAVHSVSLLHSPLGSNDEENTKGVKETVLEGFHKGSGLY